MSEEKKARRERGRDSIEDPPFMKELREMLEKGDFDCAQMMSHMRAMCCGNPKAPAEQKQSVKEKRA